MMHVNNETGVIQPVDDVARLMEGHPAYLHVDAAQGFGKEFASLRNPRVDLVSISGHKLHAPKGVGGLVVRRRGSERPPLAPLMFGGGQERGLRPGTLPVHLIVGLGLAASLAVQEAEERRRLNLAFRHAVLAALAPLGAMPNGDQSRVVPHILSISIPGVEAEQAMEALAEVVAVSNGSACTSQSLSCSHVLAGMGLSPEQAASTLRLSWCHFTPTPDWDAVVRILRALQQ
jgi:cysteine desulfurase